jgi:hypothetical protein
MFKLKQFFLSDYAVVNVYRKIKNVLYFVEQATSDSSTKTMQLLAPSWSSMELQKMLRNTG